PGTFGSRRRRGRYLVAMEHTLTGADTLVTLAEKYLGSPNRWQEIAEFNQLGYPYLVETKDDKKRLTHAHGYIYLERASSYTQATIKRGWRFSTAPSLMGGQIKVYEVTEDTTIPAGETKAYVYVRAIVKG